MLSAVGPIGHGNSSLPHRRQIQAGEEKAAHNAIDHLYDAKTQVFQVTILK